ncbi:MAG: hotdog fold thioesterase, partial [Saprospiraceae bacterium]
AKMPVDRRTHQPFKLLHGGASGVLAESLGSSASAMCVDNPMEQQVVGTELNCSHLRSARSGYVYGTCRPIKLGRKMHWWEIKITDDNDRLICVSRLTVMVVNRSEKK